MAKAHTEAKAARDAELKEYRKSKKSKMRSAGNKENHGGMIIPVRERKPGALKSDSGEMAAVDPSVYKQ